MKWNKKYEGDIESILEKGAKDAYRDNILMVYKHSDFESRMIESLIVVTVAQQLLDWTMKNYMQLHMEYPIKDFYNGAFPAFTWDGEKSIYESDRMINRINHNPPGNKTGRIDLAITQEPINEGVFYNPQWKSLVGIEVKAINKPNKAIKKDIERLTLGMVNKDKVGTNTIQLGYSLFYRRLDNPKEIIEGDKIAAKKKKELVKWDKHLQALGATHTDLNFEIKEITVKEAAFEEIKHSYDPEFHDYSDVADASGLVMCYIVKISKK